MQSLIGRQSILRTTSNVLQTRRNTISALQAAFRDPSSPYHITQGPASPDAEGLQAAAQKLTEAGFDPATFWEQRIVWGDQDAFQHVNNVRYMRFFESSRMKWIASIARAVGGQAKEEAMVKGQGVSLILKSIQVRFRRPVTYPDTLLIGYRPQDPSSDATVLNATASAYSVSQETVVAISNETLVWYDYDALKKVVPDERTRSVVFGGTS